MPLNEARGNSPRSTLTAQQKREAEAALIGLESHSPMTPDGTNLDFSAQDIERMRTIILQHDRKGVVREFDLNAPPQKPYSFQEFPKIVYNHKTGKHRRVHNAKEQQHAESQGFIEKALPADFVVLVPEAEAKKGK